MNTPNVAPSLRGNGLSRLAEWLLRVRNRLADGRVIFLVSVVVFVEIWLFLAAKGESSRLWSVLHVPSLEPPFADTITVTYSLDALNAGHDPYTFTGIDPWGRTYNYPPLWLALRHIGLTGADTNVLGVLIALAFFGAFVALLPRLRAWEGLIATAAFFSAGPMLAMERGNIDLVIFALIAFSAFLLADRRRIAAPFFVIFLASLLKYYPAACLANFVRWRASKRRVIALLTGCWFVEYLALNLDSVRLVAANTPRPIGMSYGSAVIFELYRSYSIIVKILPDPVTNARAVVTGNLILLASFALVWLFVRRFRPEPLELPDSPHPVVHAFGAGVALYIGSFMTGNNYDYRLSLLLLAIPQLLLWTREPSRRRAAAWVALFLMLISLNGRWLEDWDYGIVGELSNWALCIVLFGLYVPTLYATAPAKAAVRADAEPVPA